MNIQRNNSKVYSIKSIVIILVIITILIALCRCFLGADIGDEALYIADPHFVAHGATPYIDNWLQTPGFSFFLAPVVAVYELFFPTHQGIFLFMRFFFLVVKILIYLVTCFLFRRTYYKYIAMLVALPLITSFFSMIPSFNYTNIPLLGLLFAGILLLYHWYVNIVEGKETRFLPFINGFILAYITLCSPTQIFNCLIFIFFYYVYIDKKACWKYIISGLMTALLFFMYMLVRAGSLSGFIHSFEVFLSHPYFSFGSSTLSWQAYTIMPLAVECSVPYIVCILFIELLRLFCVKKHSFFWSCRKGLIIGAFSGMVINFVCYEQYPLWNRVIILLSIGSFCFRIIPSGITNRGVHKLFDFIAIPEMAAFFGMAITVYGGAANRFYVFIPMALICFIYIYDTLKEEIGEKTLYIVAVYVFVFLVITFKYQIQTIYGEFDDNGYASVSTLTTWVKEGVYAGILTSKEKATALQKIETEIRSHTCAGEYVLFMDRVPMAYLMTDAHFCAPTSWDPVLYSENCKNDITMLEEYFAVTDRTPDKVIYIQTSSNTPTSIEQNDYELSKYVKHFYSLKYENVVDDEFKLRVYVREK